MKCTIVSMQTLYSATTFRRLLDSMARPGKINQLEYPHFLLQYPPTDRGNEENRTSSLAPPDVDDSNRTTPNTSTVFALEEPPGLYVQTRATDTSVNLYALSAMLTLLDREVTFAVAADGHWLSHTSPIVQWLLLRSGSTLTPPESTLFAFFCQGRSDGLITQLSRGTQLEPESSATTFYCVGRLADDRPEENLDWLTLELTGPGIECTHRVSVTGLDRSEIQLINLTHQGYPLGIDVYLIDSLGRCIGLPRTTSIKII